MIAKFRSKGLELFNIIYYSCYLSLLWWLFTALGLVVIGIGPSSAVLINYINDFREHGIMYGFMDYWHDYKRIFRRFISVGSIFIVVISLMLISTRILVSVAKIDSWLISIYLLCSLLILIIAILTFCTLVKSNNVKFRISLNIGIFLTFRFPLYSLLILFGWYTLYLLFSFKLFFLFFFGPFLITFILEFFHSIMVKKMKQIQL